MVCTVCTWAAMIVHHKAPSSHARLNRMAFVADIWADTQSWSTHIPISIQSLLATIPRSSLRFLLHTFPDILACFFDPGMLEAWREYQ